jgi:hypothetical protein
VAAATLMRQAYYPASTASNSYSFGFLLSDVGPGAGAYFTLLLAASGNTNCAGQEVEFSIGVRK